MSLLLIIISLALSAISGVPALVLSRLSNVGQRIASGFMCSSAIAGLTGAGITLYSGETSVSAFPWPALGNSVVGIDALSAFFLIPVFLIGALGSIYGLGYWKQSRHPSNGRKLVLFWGLLVAGMTLLIISKHTMGFLLGWEIMALSAFFLVSTEDNRPESQSAGWIYLIATHLGTLTLFGMFALWRLKTGSYLMNIVPASSMSLSLMNVFFFLALFGFGLKAGMIPFHFWLPGAHATAPSHVSAILSGVVLKMGIYGLVRWLSLFPITPYAWGSIIIILGLTSGLLGVVFAIAQHDLKRLLAYHSIENIGIILMGLGIALLGRTVHQPILIVLGMAGCLLHVWNHCFFKTLLFFGAGAVVHCTHTRLIDKLGGLAKTMPYTALLFLVGAVAICGLPPLNGFVSELFIYLGFFNSVALNKAGLAGVSGIPILAMIGTLAGACFVKVYGTVFLGTPREDFVFKTHDPALPMMLPMVLLALICVMIGVAPFLLSTGINRAIAVWYPLTELTLISLNQVAPIFKIGIMAMVLAGGIAGVAFIILAKRLQPEACTWDCGYARPTQHMQYTASSFANSITQLFKWLLCPHENKPDLADNFPKTAKMSSHVDELVLDRLLIPFSRVAGQMAGWFHRFQKGLMQHYILYILITLFLMLCTQMPIREFFLHWFTH